MGSYYSGVPNIMRVPYDFSILEKVIVGQAPLEEEDAFFHVPNGSEGRIWVLQIYLKSKILICEQVSPLKTEPYLLHFYQNLCLNYALNPKP